MHVHVYRKLPECIVQSYPDRSAKKITIYTTSTDCKEMDDFKNLIEYEANRDLFQFEIENAIKTFMMRPHEVEGGTGIVEHIISLISALISMPENMENHEFSQRNFHQWTLGLLLRDDNTSERYIASSAHSIIEQNLSHLPLIFYTLYISPTSNSHVSENVAEVVCRESYKGFYGGADHTYQYIGDQIHHPNDPIPQIPAGAWGAQGLLPVAAFEDRHLIDVNLMPVTEAFLKLPHVNIVNRGFNDETGHFRIYEGSAEDLMHKPVYMYGNRSGRKLGRITQIKPRYIQVQKRSFVLGFAVAPEDGGTFAQPGDSGSPVVSREPINGCYIVYGMVYGGHLRIVSGTHLTYCTTYSHAIRYFNGMYGMNLQCDNSAN